MGNYQARLERLEALHAPASQVPRRFLIAFVNAQKEAVTVHANGQWFHRADDESEEQLYQRVRRAGEAASRTN